MPSPSEFVPTNIRAEMARRGVTQKDLAAALGKTQQTVSYKLSGRGSLTVSDLHQIAAVLRIPVGHLIEEPITEHAS